MSGAILTLRGSTEDSEYKLMSINFILSLPAENIMNCLFYFYFLIMERLFQNPCPKLGTSGLPVTTWPSITKKSPNPISQLIFPCSKIAKHFSRVNAKMGCFHSSSKDVPAVACWLATSPSPETHKQCLLCSTVQLHPKLWKVLPQNASYNTRLTKIILRAFKRTKLHHTLTPTEPLQGWDKHSSRVRQTGPQCCFLCQPIIWLWHAP